MKIGVYFGKNIANFTSQAGGAFTFQESIFRVLLRSRSEHEFYIFADDADKFENTSSIKFIKLERYCSGDKEIHIHGSPIKPGMTTSRMTSESFFKRLFLKIPRKLKRLKLEKNFNNALNKAVLENKIELMWFATPAYEFVQIPFIYTVWDLQHRLQSFFPEVSVSGWTFEQREKRYSFVLPRATYVIVGNQAGKDEIIRFYGLPDERIKAIPLPVPDFALNSNLSVDQTLDGLPNNFLFYPAQFWPHKNHIVILLALKILQQKYNLNLSVVFTGSDKGNLSYIKEMVDKLGLENQVHFLGFVSTQKLILLYKNAFALVFPSFFGPDNIPPLEAFALGCPVIAARVSGSEYQLDGAAILFDPKNEHELVQAIKKLYEDSALQHDLIIKGKELLKNYTSEKYIESINQIINEFGRVRRCWSSRETYVHK